jgi:predicted AAA+ superfamily ATPase
MPTTDAYRLRPWTDVVVPHADVASGDLAMGTYAANLAAVAYRTRTSPHVYDDPAAFYRSTYLTPAMTRLLADVFGVLDGRPGDRALQLRTPFGGGKTHTLLALYHLATARDEVAAAIDRGSIPDPGPVRLAVLSGEYLDPQRGRSVDGRTIETLWGELAYQLGGWEAYDALLAGGEEGTPPGGERLAALLAGGPTLVLLDEVLVYVAKGKALRRADSTAGQQALIFVQNLGEAVNQQRNAAMV